VGEVEGKVKLQHGMFEEDLGGGRHRLANAEVNKTRNDGSKFVAEYPTFLRDEEHAFKPKSAC
jgi:hypothetical protein